MHSLKNISTLEHANSILKAWWNRPKRISELRKKFPDSIERINALYRTAYLRKVDVLQIEVYFRTNQNPQAVDLTLNI